LKLSPQHILAAQHGCYYLSGEDRDALNEVAETLLADGDSEAIIRLRVDVSELARIEQESKNQGLFGATVCYALVRNAESASPKQSDHLLALAQSVEAGNRIIICAADISWKKALHKKMQALKDVACCEFTQPDVRHFHAWLKDEVAKSELRVDEAALQLVAESLCGMRLAAQQWIERLRLYDGGEGLFLSASVMTTLLGERAPDDLDGWVHAVAMKDTQAVRLMFRLLRDQQANEVQMHAWLSIRFQQLLMYRWHQAKGHSNPLQAAKVFGDARKHIPQEAKQWQGAVLVEAIAALQKVEMLLKGASVEDKIVVMERLILNLIKHDVAVV